MVRLHGGVPWLAVALGDALNAPVLGSSGFCNALTFWLALLELQVCTHDHSSTEKSLDMGSPAIALPKSVKSSCLPTCIFMYPYPFALCFCLSSVIGALVELTLLLAGLT